MNTRVTNTTMVYLTTSGRFGQATLASSLRTSRANSTILSGSPGRSGVGGRRCALGGGRRPGGWRAFLVDLALSLQETLRLSVHATILGSKEQ